MACQKKTARPARTAEYSHQEKTPAQPDVHTQSQFKKRALKGEYEDAVWQHLAGTTSARFEAGEHGTVAVKVIDDRGHELVVVRGLKEVA